MFGIVATQLVGTVTVGASGGVNTISPVRSNSPFSDLSLHVKPLILDTAYDVAVYFDGELEESHSYPDENDRVLAKMNFPMMFPANVGTNVIPKFYDPDKKDFTGDVVRVRITNNSPTQRTFEVYAVFKAWDSCRFGVIS